MRAWVHRHGLALGRVSVAAAIAVVGVPVVVAIASMIADPADHGLPPEFGLYVIAVGSGASVIVSIVLGVVAWVTRGHGAQLGKAAVIVLGAVILVLGPIFAGGYLMSVSHGQMERSPTQDFAP